MPTLTIDGRQITVPSGTTVLQACDQLGMNVPRYCYHPGLSIAGNCRICLVEIDKFPKLQISCNTPTADGMVVKTQSDKTVKARQDVLEFLLANHPLDCPVCDQAGECELQNYYMDHGLYDSRFEEQKVKKQKAVPLGETVMLDQERCILCSRCVRFTDEISKTSEFGIFDRGDHAEVNLYPGKTLDNKYAGNVVDICPVGALTDRDFRFKARVWYLSSSPSVCPGCARGCSTDIHYVLDRPYLAEGARVMRLKPRYNPDVNQWWMCDEGRYSYKSIDQARLTQPICRQGGETHDFVWELAFAEVVRRLKDAKTRGALSQWGIVPSPQMTNEELFVTKQLAQRWGIACNPAVPVKLGYSDSFLIQADKNPNRRGMETIGFDADKASLIDRALRGELRVLYVFDHDLVDLYGAEKARRLSEQVYLIYQGTNENATSQLAHLVLPSAVYAEKDGTFTNVDGHVQRTFKAFEPLQGARPTLEILFEIAKRMDEPLIYSSAVQVFKALAQAVPAFHGLDYDMIGKTGKRAPA
ncbi:MAG: (2Fe-2S)-binding protein [Candidatus Omnitrophica bacterium]|nr:(2Fe-2S)-binding protein [Candidatus Omnitrophota bacterium]